MVSEERAKLPHLHRDSDEDNILCLLRGSLENMSHRTSLMQILTFSVSLPGPWHLLSKMSREGGTRLLWASEYKLKVFRFPSPDFTCPVEARFIFACTADLTIWGGISPLILVPHSLVIKKKKQTNRETQRKEGKRLGTNLQVILSFLNEGTCLQCL